MTHVDRKGEGVDGHFFIHTYVLNTAHAAQSQTSVNLVHVFEQLHYQFLLKCMVFSGSVKRPCGSTRAKGVSKMSKISFTWFMNAPIICTHSFLPKCKCFDLHIRLTVLSAVNQKILMNKCSWLHNAISYIRLGLSQACKFWATGGHDILEM